MLLNLMSGKQFLLFLPFYLIHRQKKKSITYWDAPIPAWLNAEYQSFNRKLNILLKNFVLYLRTSQFDWLSTRIDHPTYWWTCIHWPVIIMITRVLWHPMLLIIAWTRRQCIYLRRNVQWLILTTNTSSIIPYIPINKV